MTAETIDSMPGYVSIVGPTPHRETMPTVDVVAVGRTLSVGGKERRITIVVGRRADHGSVIYKLEFHTIYASVQGLE